MEGRDTGIHASGPGFNSNLMNFRIDTPALIQEIGNNAKEKRTPELIIPLNILLAYLTKLASRAAELNDPELNIIMLEMKLYDVPHDEIDAAIQTQKALINEKI